MRSARGLLHVLLISLLFPLSASAFRSRPTSDLRFQNRAAAVEAKAATDGASFTNAGALQLIHPNVSGPHAATFDGRDFYAVLSNAGAESVTMSRITAAGAVTFFTFRRDNGEMNWPGAVAADAKTRALFGFNGWHPASRIDSENFDVRWQKPSALNALLGIAIEVRLPDGAWRSMAVAPPGSTSARVTLAESARPRCACARGTRPALRCRRPNPQSRR